MKSALGNREEIARRLGTKRVVLFLDYDGTLAPIASSPGRAVLPAQARELLRRLVRCPRVQPVVISGRALRDVCRLVGMRGIVYAGNHGMEIRGCGLRLRNSVSRRARRLMNSLREELNAQCAGMPGALVENKGFTLSIHYRLVSPGNLPRLKRIFAAATRQAVQSGDIAVNPGKKVYEIKPRGAWDKGVAARWIVSACSAGKRTGTVAIFVGDDTTDEDAFKALRNDGITVVVGKRVRSHADYYVNGTRGVLALLKSIVDATVPRTQRA